MSIWMILILIACFIFVVWLARTQISAPYGRWVIIGAAIVLLIIILNGIGVFNLGSIGGGSSIRVR